MADPVAELIDEFLALKWRGKPMERTVTLVESSPHEATRLVLECLRRLPQPETFMALACDFLPAEDWPKVVVAALDAAEAGGDYTPADWVVACASMQSPQSLHPHLDRIFRVRPAKESYSEPWPWRDSGTTHLAALQAVVSNAASSDEDRRRAWHAIVETRTPEGFRFAIKTYDSVQPSTRYGLDSLERFLWSGGLDRRDGGKGRMLERPHRVMHLRFDPSYLRRGPTKKHPTWDLPATGPAMRLGGEGDGNCNCCGNSLHHLITLDPMPPKLGVNALARLTLSTCLSCLGWETNGPAFYTHDASGKPHDVTNSPKRKPEVEHGPLEETTVHLVDTPARWHWQDWGLANGAHNLHRLGGHPCWVQAPDYPACPRCRERMPFLMQFDSDLPATSMGEFPWGSGGVCYAFWCDACRVSALHWQCT